MKKFEFFDTDFYQLSMAYIYIMEGRANTIVGFEGFVRHIKPEVSSTPFYYFDGAEHVHRYMDTIREEFKYPILVDAFVELIKDKLSPDGNWEAKFRNEFSKLNFNFEYKVAYNNSIVFAQVPVFQFRGPVWIGQIIETMTTNSYNGATGLNSVIQDNVKNKRGTSQSKIDYLSDIVNNVGGDNYESYMRDINTQAKRFKMAAGDSPLFEAAFRRSANKEIAYMASKMAIKNGWFGTSNTSIRDIVEMKYIGGSMAHAFVMFFKTELEAFETWMKYFPNSTILIDTYNTIEATKMLIEYNIKPKDVRIDSGDFFVITQQVRELLDAAGWKDVGIFLSGDITIDMIYELKAKKVPFNKLMAGTKYVYNNEVINCVNSGFVYKLVEVHNVDGISYPEKKADNKKNYAGLKKIDFIKNVATLSKIEKNEKLDLSDIRIFSTNTKIVFI